MVVPIDTLKSIVLGSVLAIASSLPAMADTIYVSNEKDNTISVVDGDTLTVTETIRVGRRPRGITFNHDMTQLYVCIGDENRIDVIDLSTNKVVMDEGAVEDMDAFEEEVSRPDAIIVKKPGKELILGVDRELSTAHLELMSRSIGMVQQMGGVTDELLGRSTNAVSGVAIQARQEQGSVATNKLFDNLRLGQQQRGEIQLSLVEQFMTEEKQFRITNARGVPTFVAVNDGLPENDITRTKADFVISEAEWRASLRQAAVEQFAQLLTRMPPEVAMVVLDLLVDAMDIPNREEIVKRIRQMTGQRDPDATEPTPEEVQAANMAAEQARRADAMFQAELAGKQAKAMQGYANAQKTLRQLAAESVGAQKAAFETALLLLGAPQAAIAADAVLETAGYEDSMAKPPPMGLPPAPQPEPQQQPLPPVPPPAPQQPS